MHQTPITPPFPFGLNFTNSPQYIKQLRDSRGLARFLLISELTVVRNTQTDGVEMWREIKEFNGPTFRRTQGRNLMKKMKALSIPTFLLTSLLLAAMPATSFAQCVGGCLGCEPFIYDLVAEPGEVQGPIQSISVHSEGAEVVVMGFTIIVTADPDTGVSNVPMASTVNTALTLDQILDQTPFRGRPSFPGFVGGSGVISVDGRMGGEFPDSLRLCASNVYLEVAEHTAGGPLDANELTSAFGGSAMVMGQEVKFANDPRLGQVSLTDTGLTLDPSTAREGGLTSVEGYLGEDGVLYMAVFEAPGESAVLPQEVSVARARCSNDQKLRANGGSTQIDGTVEICNKEGSLCYGTVLVTAVAPGDVAQGGEWRFQNNNIPLSCPTQIRATHENGTWTVGDVDVR